MLTPETILQKRYYITRHVGQGGMGSVYEAFDTRLNKRVAIKQTNASDAQFRQAFLEEAHLLARLDHEALPGVIDYFVEDDGQFLVMKYIDGKDLGALLQERSTPFTLDLVLAWANRLLDALEYLHAQKPPIIHRDIKPQNLKLTPPPASKLYLLDFGLAKSRPDHSVQAFTLEYSPPEQVSQRGTDARSDLYALGVTLHHLLTRTDPAGVATRLMARSSQQPDPQPSVALLNPDVPWSVSNAIDKAMEIDPNDRYQSAAEMRVALNEAARETDQTRHDPRTQRLDALPQVQTDLVQALSPTIVSPVSAPLPPTIAGPLQRVPQPVRRESSLIPLASGLGLLMVLLLLLGAAGAGWYMASQSGVNGVAGAGRTATPLSAAALASATPTAAAATPTTAAVSPTATAASPTAVPNREIWNDPLQTFAIDSVAFSPDGKFLGIAIDSKNEEENYTIQLWDVDDGVRIRTLRGHDARIWDIAFAPEDDLVASAADDKTVRIWNTATGELLLTLEGHTGQVYSVTFAPDGATLASASSDGSVRLWNVASGEEAILSLTHASRVYDVDFAADSSTLASASDDNMVRIWDIASGELIHTLAGHARSVRSIAFDPAGTLLASGSDDVTIRLWDPAIGELIGVLEGETVEGFSNTVTSLDFSSDGAWLAVGWSDNTIQVWDVQQRALLHTLDGHMQRVLSVAFAPGAKTLASGSRDGSVRLWLLDEE